MAQNLANLYAFMRKTFKDCSILYVAPVSYIQRITGQTNKVIFVCEEDRSKIKQLAYVSPSKLNIKKDGGLDLTGSPLKDDCYVDAINESFDTKFTANTPWSSEEECYKGVSLNLARSILCDFNFQKEALSASGSVWILCAGSDEQNTVLLEMEFAKASNIRGILKYKGVVSTSDVKASDMVEQHLMIMKNSTKINAQIDSIYNIKSNMSIKVSWTTSSLRSLNNLKNSDVILSQTFCVNDCSSLTEDFLNQLKILAYIKEDIVEYKKKGDENKDPIYRCGRGIEIDELKSKILAVMTEFSGFFELEGTTFEIESVVQRAKERTPTDLTDKLWEIIKCCSSYMDLKKAFNYTFQCAAKCNIVNLPTNSNRLAEIINEVSQQRLAIPCLTGSEPLELLLEIGLEKLFKDYEFIFTESKICSSKDLRAAFEPKSKEVDANDVPMSVRKSIRSAVRTDAPSSHRKTLLHNNFSKAQKNRDSDIVGFQNSAFHQADVEGKLARLLQIHFALEHLMLIQINLNLENVYVQVCEQLLKRSPRMYKTIDDSMTDKIEIPMNPDSFIQHLEGKEPNTRKVTLSSQNNFREIQSTFFYSMENIFPPSAAECYGADDKEILKDNVYFSWQYTKIKSKRS